MIPLTKSSQPKTNSPAGRVSSRSDAPKPRCAKVSGKLAAPKLVKALRAWFLEESLTYLAVQSRLKKKFGVRTSLSHLGRFWQRHCRQPAEAEALPSPLLDVVIECASPVRLKILRRQAGIQITTTPTPTPTAAVGRKGRP